MKNRQLVAATRATQDQSELARDISIVAQLSRIINARTETTSAGATQQK